jgi:antitoxin component of MazEF toxin-antitoxin module
MGAITAKKWGNSLGVRLPALMANQLQIEDGSELNIEIKGNQLIITPIFPEADDQQALRELFLRLRSSSKPGTGAPEAFVKAMGDEEI